MSNLSHLTSVNQSRASFSKTYDRHASGRAERLWPNDFDIHTIYSRANDLRAQAMIEFIASLGRGIAAGIRWLASIAASYLAGIRETAAAWRAYEKLSRMSDRQLTDIGLARSDIAAVAFRHFHDAEIEKTRHFAMDPVELGEEDVRKAA